MDLRTKIKQIFLLSILSAPVLAGGGGADGIEGTEQLFGMWGNVVVNGKFAKDSPWLWYGDLSLRAAQQYGYPGNNDELCSKVVDEQLMEAAYS